MKKSDLHREWARVLDMCEGTNVDPRSCWSYGGILSETHTPAFYEDPLEKYEFAVAILEDKPVFVGDKVYGKYSNTFYTVSKEMIDRGGHDYSDNNYWSWNPPKKTFMLNGEELPCPVDEDGDLYILKIESGNNYKKHISFRFNRIEDRDKVADAIIKLLKESTGNGE